MRRGESVLSREKIVFMGTAAFAVPSLRFLVTSRDSPLLVVTQPDKPSGRGRRLQQSPIKDVAQEFNLPLVQPAKLKNNAEFRKCLEALEPSLVVVVAYGKILPAWLLQLPQRGCINLHASVLPAYRGAAPIQWSLINGESETGVTLMEMVEELDAGNIIYCEKTNIDPEENYGDLQERLQQFGPRLLERYLMAIAKGDAVPSCPQNKKAVSYAPMITKELSQVDWTKDSVQIHNLVRALAPKPLAYTSFRGRRLKIVKTSLSTGESAGFTAGKIVGTNERGMLVACGNGTLLVQEVIPQDRARMPAASFAAGSAMRTGERVG